MSFKQTLSKLFYIFVLIYIVIFHAILISLIVKPSLSYAVATRLKLNPVNEKVIHYMASMNTMHTRVDRNTPNGAFIFIGDSLIQGLSVSSIRPISVNFGIGHDYVNNLSNRSSNYESLKSASSIIISVGINDLRKRSVERTITDYTAMLYQLNELPKVYIHEVLPIDSQKLGVNLQKKITSFNDELYKLAIDFDNIELLRSSSEFFDLDGNLKPTLHLGDGLHLNKKGYEIWIQQLRQQLDAK